MQIDHPKDTAPLRRLWQEAFGDTDAFLDLFFRYGYQAENALCAMSGDTAAAALYWLDCAFRGQKIAYIYAVATNSAFRNQGLCRALMEKAHKILAQRGYAGAVLVPAEKSLFSMYEKMGYRTATTMASFSCKKGEAVSMRPVTVSQYAALRRRYLPEDGCIQEGNLLEFLGSYASFYAGADFLLAGYADEGRFCGLELLGNTAAAPGILAALGLPEGNFRCPGAGAPFAMYLPLSPAEAPGYFGLALD